MSAADILREYDRQSRLDHLMGQCDGRTGKFKPPHSGCPYCDRAWEQRYINAISAIHAKPPSSLDSPGEHDSHGRPHVKIHDGRLIVSCELPYGNGTITREEWERQQHVQHDFPDQP